MVNKSDVWEISKNIIRITNPLTAMMIDTVEKSVSKSNVIAEKGDLEEMKLEATRQEVSTRISELQAKVAQELAIANRIDTAEEVTIEEYYDVTGEGAVGLNGSQENITLGINGSGRKVTKRIYKFKGFRNNELKVVESTKNQ